MYADLVFSSISRLYPFFPLYKVIPRFSREKLGVRYQRFFQHNIAGIPPSTSEGHVLGVPGHLQAGNEHMFIDCTCDTTGLVAIRRRRWGSETVGNVLPERRERERGGGVLATPPPPP